MIVDKINTESILKLRSIIRPRFTIVLDNRADTLTRFSNILYLDSNDPVLQFQINSDGKTIRTTPK
ncbi:MAG: hypothetical protein GX640_15875 [Fibrobacter sp.]|nr:hypothetical protein [Fibrobacter sp.]